MSYKPTTNIPANTVLGNPTGSAAAPQAITLSGDITVANGQLMTGTQPGRTTTGDVTLTATDINTTILGNDPLPTHLILPTGLPKGFKVRSYQYNRGSITYVPAQGATLVNGAARSMGTLMSGGYFVDIENVGGDAWLITGTPAPGHAKWGIFSMPQIREGDTCSFTLYAPDNIKTNYPATIQVTGTGFTGSGTDRSLIAALAEINGYDSNITFDGVSTLTINSGARNPITLAFFINPDYTANGNKTISISLSNPSFGTVDSANASASTTIIDTSRPVNPAELFTAIQVVTATDSPSGQNQITLTSLNNVTPPVLQTTQPTAVGICFVSTSNAGIPALTWITSISGNTLTLNTNLTADIPPGTTLTFTSPGIWIDMTNPSANNMQTSASLANPYYVNSTGVLTSTTPSTPRFTYDPVALTLKGLVYEPMAVNLCKYSNLASWSMQNGTIVLNNATSPLATTTAAKISNSTSNAAHYLQAANGDISYVVNTPYTYSVFLKAGTETVAQLSFNNACFGTTQYANFDLQNAVVGTTVGVTAKMVPYGNGWYRCEIEAVCTSTASGTLTGYIIFTNNNASAARMPAYAGPATPTYFYAFGAQLEATSISSSYIATASGSTTGQTRAPGNMFFTIPTGVTGLTVTYADASTQSPTVTPGTVYYLPTNLNGTGSHVITSIVGTGGGTLNYNFTTGTLPTGVTYTQGMDGLRISSVTDAIFGYSFTNPTANTQPVFMANSINGLGSLGNNISANQNSGLSIDYTKFANATVTQTLSAAWSGTGTPKSFTLNSVTNVQVGMILYSATYNFLGNVVSIVGNTVTVTGGLPSYGNLSINASLIFYFLNAVNHPMINYSDHAINLNTGAPILGSSKGGTTFVVAKLLGPTVGNYIQCASGIGNSITVNIQNFTGAASQALAFFGTNQHVNYANNSLNIPYIAQTTGVVANQVTSYPQYSTQQRINGQCRFIMPMITTAPTPSGTLVNTVDDTTGVFNGMGLTSAAPGFDVTQSLAVGTINSSTSFNEYPFNASQTIPTGSSLIAFNRMAQGNLTGTLTPNFSTSIVGLYGEVSEIISIGRTLSDQEIKGVHLYLANKYRAVSGTATVTTDAPIGSYKLYLNNITGFAAGNVINGPGIATDTYITAVNTTNNYLRIDTATTADVPVGTTITSSYCAYRKPTYLDITQYTAIYRDDFTRGVNLWNGTKGWVPYYGDPNSPGFYNTAYATYGHGSENGGSVWNLDVLNYKPWLQYDPYTSGTTIGAPSGEMIITSSPASATLMSQMGYGPGETQFTYSGGVLMGNKEFAAQYFYTEARMRFPKQTGNWTAYWMEAACGLWPPEIDMAEVYGNQPGVCTVTLHGNKLGPTGTSASDHSQGGMAEIVVDFTVEYVVIGVEVTPTYINHYVNRQKISQIAMPWDFHTPWIIILDLDANGGQDNVTPMDWHVDYMAHYKLNLQNPTVPTATQAETTALLAAMTVQPTSGRQTLINTLISSLKTYQTSFGQSLWSALDFLYIPAAHDAQAARINWKNPSIVGTVVGSGLVYTTDRGVSGVAGSSYIDSGLNLSTASGLELTTYQNHIGVYNSASTAGSSTHVVTENEYFTGTVSSPVTAGQSTIGLSNIQQTVGTTLSTAAAIGQSTVTLTNVNGITVGSSAASAAGLLPAIVKVPTTTSWNNSGVTLTAGQNDPFGTTLAVSVISTTAANATHIYYITASGLSTTSPSTYSIYLKSAGYQYCQIRMQAASSYSTAMFDLTNGLVVSTTNISMSAASISSVGNGWYRVAIYGQALSAGYIVVAPSPTSAPSYDANLNPLFTGDGASGVYACAAQVNPGSQNAASIPTVATTVTGISGNNVTFSAPLSGAGAVGSGFTFTGAITNTANMVGSTPISTSLTTGTTVTAANSNTVSLSAIATGAIAAGTVLTFALSSFQVDTVTSIPTSGAVSVTGITGSPVISSISGNVINFTSGVSSYVSAGSTITIATLHENGTANFYVQPFALNNTISAKTLGPYSDGNNGSAAWGAGSPSYNPWTTGTIGHAIASRDYIHVTAFMNGKCNAVYQGGNNVAVTLDNSDLLIANGPSQCLAFHGGFWLTPDDAGYLYNLLNTYLHALGAV